MNHYEKILVEKFFINDKPYLISTKLTGNDTCIIGAYMKENNTQYILNSLRDLLKRIKRKHKNPNIIFYGDCNTNKKWDISYIEEYTNLRKTE